MLKVSSELENDLLGVRYAKKTGIVIKKVQYLDPVGKIAVLIGQIPLEEMDGMVHPAQQRLVPGHEGYAGYPLVPGHEGYAGYP